jgi:hypothetical protein
MEDKKSKLQGMTQPGPAMYPMINRKGETIGRDTCTARGVTIAPRYREKHSVLSGPGPAMVERELLDKGVREIEFQCTKKTCFLLFSIKIF